jgi:hypothetical protein
VTHIDDLDIDGLCTRLDESYWNWTLIKWSKGGWRVTLIDPHPPRRSADEYRRFDGERLYDVLRSAAAVSITVPSHLATEADLAWLEGVCRE